MLVNEGTQKGNIGNFVLSAEVIMGPSLLDRPAPALKKGFTKERNRNKVTAVNSITSSSKKGKSNLNHRASKKPSVQSKNSVSRQIKDLSQGPERASQRRGCRLKPGNMSATENDPVQQGKKEEGPEELYLKQPVYCSSRVSEFLEMPKDNQESSDSSPGPSRKGSKMFLQLLPSTSEKHLAPVLQVPSLETLRLYEEEEGEVDSASDLSDSERLPVPPSPCSPPELHLRAEVFDPNDLDSHPSNPRGLQGGYDYPDFLPPPFNTWSLRQLAVFLNTEGRQAPRPQPVGHLERYLERLLQLEWLQIQTVQAENSKSSTATTSTSRTRPHTAPPGYLNSPKTLRQCQRTFPIAFLSCLGSASSAQLSQAACPYCRVRYPFCNGACRSYAYQRHSRFSLAQERSFATGTPQRRSSSETRTSMNRKAVGTFEAQKPGSSTAGSSHLSRMQSAGNIRYPPHSPTMMSPSKSQTASKNVSIEGLASKNGKGRSGDYPGACSKVRETSPLRRQGNERQKSLKQVTRLLEKEPSTNSVESPSNKVNGRVKHVQFLTK
ncbi:protein FAM217B-like [Polypterus senegalus]|uniref:protein FAM217B-like n=1 Tax=Polypterus senegalus TaxID=55291 RepID=UPI0019650C74|nr:protein FAM217B-like [Polypterus senegalus]